MRVNYFAIALERALVPDDPQLDQRSLGERSQRVNVAAPDAQFRNAGRESGARMEIGYFSGSDKWAATNRTLIGPLRRFFLLDHQHQYAASSKTIAQGVFAIAWHLPSIIGLALNTCCLPRFWLFTSRRGNSAVTRGKPIWLDVTIVTAESVANHRRVLTLESL